MLILHVQKDGHACGDFSLHEGEYVIGREANAQIRLQHAGVSRWHAKLVLQESRILVQDLQSQNGTWYNNKRISQQEVRAGEQFRIAEYVLRLEREKAAAQEKLRTSSFAKTLRRVRNSKWLYVFAPVSLFLICFYSLSLGDSSGKAKAPPSKKIAKAAEHAAKGSALSNKHEAITRPQKRAVPTAESRQAFAGIVQKLQLACAHKDSALLAQVKTQLDSMRLRAPQLYDYKFWQTYISEKQNEFAQTTSYDSANVSKVNPAQVLLVTPRRQSNWHEQKQARRAEQIAQTNPAESASLRGEDKPRATIKKIAGPRPAANKANDTQKALTAALSENQKAEAEQLYVQAYKIMAYKNRNAYLQAVMLFKKAQQAAPDPKFKYYQKAGEKMAVIEKELAKLENQ